MIRILVVRFGGRSKESRVCSRLNAFRKWHNSMIGERRNIHLSREGDVWYFVGCTVSLFCLCLDRIMSGLALSNFIWSQSKLNWGRYSVRLVISNRRAEMAWLWVSDQLVIIVRSSWKPQRSFGCQGVHVLFSHCFNFFKQKYFKGCF